MRVTNSELLLSGIFLLLLGVFLVVYLVCDFNVENCKPSIGNPRNVVVVFMFLGGFLISMGLGRKQQSFYSELKCPMPTRRQLAILTGAIVTGTLLSVYFF